MVGTAEAAAAAVPAAASVPKQNQQNPRGSGKGKGGGGKATEASRVTPKSEDFGRWVAMTQLCPMSARSHSIFLHVTQRRHIPSLNC